MNILFTCAGRRNYLLGYFRDALAGKGLILAADASKYAPALAEADKSFIVPTIYDQNYIDELLNICRKHNPGLLIPLNDLELPLLSSHRDEFLQLGTFPLVSSSEVIDICFDKWKTTQFSESIGIKSPSTYTVLDEAITAVKSGRVNYPLILKPRWGSASIGIEVVQDESELQIVYNLLKKRLRSTILGQVSSTDLERAILIQQRLTGEEYGLDVVNDLKGNNVAVFVKRKLSMRAGETDRAITVDVPVLLDIGRKIGINLRHIGNLDCDVFLTNDGPYLLEMNPRFGGGYPFSHLAGANVPAAIIAWVRGNKVDPKWFEIRHNVFSAKYDRLIEVRHD